MPMAGWWTASTARCAADTASTTSTCGAGCPRPACAADPTRRRPAKRELTEQELPAFLAGGERAYCRTASFAQPCKFRWEKRLTSAQVDQMTRELGVGRVRALAVVERGVSGRAKLLTISGEEGASQVRGELNIRRLFGMLNSAMFTLHEERDARGQPVAWTFRGGGWGHGVGLCQTGAIGRAEAGQDYRTILRHYFNGAEVAPIY